MRGIGERHIRTAIETITSSFVRQHDLYQIVRQRIEKKQHHDDTCHQSFDLTETTELNDHIQSSGIALDVAEHKMRNESIKPPISQEKI